jgi:hypothetical protein
MRRGILLSLAIFLPFSATAYSYNPPPILDIHPIPQPINNIITLDPSYGYGNSTTAFTVGTNYTLSMSAATTLLQASSLTNLGTLNLSGVVDLNGGTLSSTGVLNFNGQSTVNGNVLASLGNNALGGTGGGGTVVPPKPVGPPGDDPGLLAQGVATALQANDPGQVFVYATGSISLAQLNVNPAAALAPGKYLLAASESASAISIDNFTVPANSFLVTDAVQVAPNQFLQIAYLEVVPSGSVGVLAVSGKLRLGGVVDLNGGTLSSTGVIDFTGQSTVVGTIMGLVGNNTLGGPVPHPVGPGGDDPGLLAQGVATALQANDPAQSFVYATGNISLQHLNVVPATATLAQGKYLLAVSESASAISIDSFTVPANSFLVTDAVQVGNQFLQIAYLEVVQSNEAGELVVGDLRANAMYRTLQYVRTGSALNLTGTVLQAEKISATDDGNVDGSVTVTAGGAIYAGAGGLNAPGSDCSLLGVQPPHPAGPGGDVPFISKAIDEALTQNGFEGASSFIYSTGAITLKNLTFTLDQSAQTDKKYVVALSESGISTGITTPAQGYGYGRASITTSANVGTSAFAVSSDKTQSRLEVIYVGKDDKKPVIKLPDTMPKEFAKSPSGATANFTVSADDNFEVKSFDCDHLSGAVFPVGKTPVTCTATDTAGNSSSASFNVSVVYNFTGFFEPVDNRSTFVNEVKAGSAIPFKFSLGGYMGLNGIVQGIVTVPIQCSNLATDLINDSETVIAAATTINYDPIADVYNYVWKTTKSLADGNCYQVQLILNDGLAHGSANFRFK